MNNDGLAEGILFVAGLVGVALKRYWPKIAPLLEARASEQVKTQADDSRDDDDPVMLAYVGSEARRLELQQQFTERGMREQYQKARDAVDGVSIRLNRLEEFHNLFKPDYENFKTRFKDLTTRLDTVETLVNALKASPANPAVNINVVNPPATEGGSS